MIQVVFTLWLLGACVPVSSSVFRDLITQLSNGDAMAIDVHVLMLRFSPRELRDTASVAEREAREIWTRDVGLPRMLQSSLTSHQKKELASTFRTVAWRAKEAVVLQIIHRCTHQACRLGNDYTADEIARALTLVNAWGDRDLYAKLLTVFEEHQPWSQIKT
jgi:hypothetical protein